MATYKVLQDIEAEDKLLGPLTFRQFIYALITAVCLYFCVIAVLKNVPFLLVIFLPPALFTGFFAYPWAKDQPTEVWALARIQFLFKPHRRIWDQSGIKELVTITAPKRDERQYTDGLSQTEVKSRLRALADTIDSRGWVTKNVNLNAYSQPSLLAGSNTSDRLIDLNAIPQEVPNFDVGASDDMFDTQSNPLAQQFDQMINASAQAHRAQIVQQLSQPQAAPAAATPQTGQAPADYWFLSQPTQAPAGPKDAAVFAKPAMVFPGVDNAGAGLPAAATPSADEEALAEQLKARHDQPEVAYSHLKTIQPLGSRQAAQQMPASSPAPPVTPQPDPAILELANNNDLNVATLARQANKSHKSKEPPQDEVVISLH